MKFNLLKEKKIRKEMKLIKDSGLFSSSFYLENYLDVKADPIKTLF